MMQEANCLQQSASQYLLKMSRLYTVSARHKEKGRGGVHSSEKPEEPKEELDAGFSPFDSWLAGLWTCWGFNNRSADKPLSMRVRMFPERLHGGQKAHPGHWQEHSMGWGPGLGTSEVAGPQHPPGLPDCDAT